ncbi:MAG: helix-turn-helix domain-containing protein [Pararhodobacter sp.]|nr:helix-turn-helix domain-containing protein [Pararhodobacter sp.]
MVKSAIRVIQILELFDKKQTSLSIQQIVNELGLPQSSVSSLVQSLFSMGYLNRMEGSRAFEPSERLAFLGNWTLGMPRGVEAVNELLHDLSEITGEAALLGCRSGFFLRYVAITESPHALRFALPVNQIRPLQSCGLGIMVLTQMTDEAVTLLVRRFNVEQPEHGLKRPENEILADVRLAREQGYFETFGIVTSEVGTISTMMNLPKTGRSLAIGIGGPLTRLNPNREWLRDTLLQKVREFERGFES